MISGIGWVSELIEVAGGITSLPIVHPANRPRIVS